MSQRPDRDETMHNTVQEDKSPRSAVTRQPLDQRPDMDATMHNTVQEDGVLAVP